VAWWPRRYLLDVGEFLRSLIQIIQAYILGKHDDQYQDIISRVFGMVFLSTPHRGSQDARLVNTILATFPFASSKIYIAEMATGSITLQDINDQFRNQCSGLKLVSFFETQATNLRVAKDRIVSFLIISVRAVLSL
jgi:hypothetical protein